MSGVSQTRTRRLDQPAPHANLALRHQPFVKIPSLTSPYSPPGPLKSLSLEPQFIIMTFLRLIPYQPPDYHQGRLEKSPSSASSPQDSNWYPDATTAIEARHFSITEWLANNESAMGRPVPTTITTTNTPISTPSSLSPASAALTTPNSNPQRIKDSPGSILPPRLEAAIRAAREAETLHAYDVGVCAALESMSEYWTRRSRRRHVSSSEKRIFSREAQRLADLVVNAEQEAMASNERLLRKQGIERAERGVLSRGWGRWKEVKEGGDVGQEGHELGVENDVVRLTESIGNLKLGTPSQVGMVAEKVEKLRGAAVVKEEEKGSESSGDENLRTS
ncbi:hypothetical protein B0H67DRAFT_319573 [Lasiosphaeris hirsuta]|uniref:Uncharacterized protein n=1 Tax=Lasiosphaeris hirsuta TaxID=260670 RepID=A0AA40A1R2_9PEZI|nr:hypothetical protein B0H67DRAFT_319573 [Lasiosphaeris hirsuta]